MKLSAFWWFYWKCQWFVTVALLMAKYWNSGYMQCKLAYVLGGAGKISLLVFYCWFNYCFLPFAQAVTLHTDVGDIKIELFCERTPKTCEVSWVPGVGLPRDCLVVKQSSRNSENCGGGEVAFAIPPFHVMNTSILGWCNSTHGTWALCHTARVWYLFLTW